MPNHITNIIRADQRVLDALAPGGKVNFETVVPIPDNIYQGDLTSFWENGTFHTVPSNPADRAKEWAGNWYEWSRIHWGTKWNAYGQPDQQAPGELRFDTAWNQPGHVITALSKRFPDEPIQVAYADEDTGYNLGVYRALNGRVTHLNIPATGTPDAENLACLIRYNMTAREYYDDLYQGEDHADIPDRKDALDDRYDPFDRIADVLIHQEVHDDE